MRMDTLEYNELENLCLLLPEQDQLVLRGKYSCEEGWQQLDMELSLPTADTPVLTDTYDGVQVQLEETQGTITRAPRQRPTNGATLASGWNRRAPTPFLAPTMNMWMCASGSRRTDSSTRWSIC